jgi:hypothetical protein
MNLSASIYRFKSVNRRLCDLINVGSSYKDITSETLKIEIKCPIAKLSNATKIILKSYGKCTKNTIKKNFNDLLLVFSLMDDSLTKNGEFDTVLNRLLTVWSQDDYLSKKYSLQTLYTILPKSNDVFFAYVK